MSDDESEAVTDLSNPDVTTKYMESARITNKALESAIAACIAGADIHTICAATDALIEAETGKLYNKKKESDKNKIEKGVAFPTCISVNEICGNFSPLPGESVALQEGDVAKIALATHIDGYIASAAHTVLVGGANVTDRRADVINAAHTTAEAVLRLVKTGNTNTAVTEAIAQCASEYECAPLQGVLSHELKKHIIDGQRSIINCETVEERVEEFEFGLNEVFNIDIMVSTGEGKTRETEIRSTVFKRALENTYVLKTAKARQFISEVAKKAPTLPFSLRSFEETVGRIGVSESKRHDLLHEYPILHEKQGEFVAQFSYTVLLLPGGTKRVTGAAFGQAGQLQSSHAVKDEGILKLLATSANPKKNKKKKRAAEE